MALRLCKQSLTWRQWYTSFFLRHERCGKICPWFLQPPSTLAYLKPMNAVDILEKVRQGWKFSWHILTERQMTKKKMYVIDFISHSFTYYTFSLAPQYLVWRHSAYLAHLRHSTESRLLCQASLGQVSCGLLLGIHSWKYVQIFCLVSLLPLQMSIFVSLSNFPLDFYQMSEFRTSI